MLGTSQTKKIQRWSTRERHAVDMSAGLDQVLTIRSRPLCMTQSQRPGALPLPTQRQLWHYEARFQSGELAATMNLGEGIVVPGCTDIWRVTQRNGVCVLVSEAGPEATFYTGGTGIFSRIQRLTLGSERFGGYEVDGHDWSVGWVTQAATGKRVLSIFGDDFAAGTYHVAPTGNGEPPPLSAVMLLAYVLTEREVRNACWIPKPGAAAA